MDRLRYTLTSLLLVCVGLLGNVAFADDSQPGYLEIKETTANRYSVLWRTPNLKGRRSPLALQFPPSVRNLTEPVVHELPGSLVERRLIEADAGGLIGKHIEIAGLNMTRTEVLVRVAFANGAISTSLLKPAQPWLVAFSFGLLHGLGFAGALADVGLPQHEIPLALLMFNVGVELGQVMFVILMLGLISVLRQLRSDWPAWSRQLPAYGIGSMAALWFLDRVSGF